ncbi:TetR family transcriptional regulator [Streptomyces coeruleoprunus]|uniref:TetR family transcriptional regulator n=1 Tax=Streptomyces coeruleoprunus TaxID=285563 RepID=A0ABV9XM37_9ACTN
MGLRERKKLKTRAAIRRAAHRLVGAQGYETTTIEQIARAAEVSPSTVLRYFATKEDIVLDDAYEPLMEAALRARPPGEEPLESLRVVITGAVRAQLEAEPAETAQRARLLAEVPAVRARLSESLSGTSHLLARVLAERAGRAPDDLSVRVCTAAVTGALREVLLHWATTGAEEDLLTLTDEAFTTLKSGFRL